MSSGECPTCGAPYVIINGKNKPAVKLTRRMHAVHAGKRVDAYEHNRRIPPRELVAHYERNRGYQP